jgi:catechol 2,3-dioxygenase-like lactoylglutathione lyase family enzyme
MLSYLMLGANDLVRSERFYSAILAPLGYEKAERTGKIIYSFPDMPDRYNGPGAVYITKPYDGREATPGNGVMPAFRTETRALVDQLHAAGLAAGGTDEGGPGIRAEYSSNFHVAYLRDPLGNKLALFCTAEG